MHEHVSQHEISKRYDVEEIKCTTAPEKAELDLRLSPVNFKKRKEGDVLPLEAAEQVIQFFLTPLNHLPEHFCFFPKFKFPLKSLEYKLVTHRILFSGSGSEKGAQF